MKKINEKIVVFAMFLVCQVLISFLYWHFTSLNISSLFSREEYLKEVLTCLFTYINIDLWYNNFRNLPRNLEALQDDQILKSTASATPSYAVALLVIIEYLLCYEFVLIEEFFLIMVKYSVLIIANNLVCGLARKYYIKRLVQKNI